MSKNKIPDWDDGYGGDLDQPWSETFLRRQQKTYKDMDVCGAMQECDDEKCPCFLLKDLTTNK